MGLLKVKGWSQGSRSLHLSKGCFFLQDHTSPSTRKALSRKPAIHSCCIDGDNLNPMLSEKACVQGSKIHNCFIQLQGRHSPGLKTVSHINGRHKFKYPNHSCFCYKNCHSINLCESSDKHHLVRYHGSKFQCLRCRFFIILFSDNNIEHFILSDSNIRLTKPSKDNI